MRIALVCIAKNEDNYIDEWIEYHLKLGITKIFVYQNNWRYNGKFLNSEFVKLYEYDGELKQTDAYNDFISNQYMNYDWAGFIDVDEFVVLKQDINISSFLEKYNNYNSVGLNWNMFGSNGLKFNGEYSVIKRFIKCHKELIHEIKCFLNLNKNKNTVKFKKHFPHNIINRNFTISVDKTHYINGPFNEKNLNNKEIAYINHYYIKTKEEFDNKIKRGWPIPINNSKNFSESLFKKYDLKEYNEVEDLTAYKFMFNEERN